MRSRLGRDGRRSPGSCCSFFCSASPPRPSEKIRDSEGTMKITATIITLNEERNIARAMESLRCCDEIVVLDSGSVDRAVELAGNLGAVVVEDAWRGYAGQKNRAAECAGNDWILSLDAD